MQDKTLRVFVVHLPGLAKVLMDSVHVPIVVLAAITTGHKILMHQDTVKAEAAAYHTLMVVLRVHVADTTFAGTAATTILKYVMHLQAILRSI